MDPKASSPRMSARRAADGRRFRTGWVALAAGGWGAACLLLFAPPAAAERGVLVLHVSDVKDRPMAGVVLATEGDGASGKSDPAGKMRIGLAPQTLPEQQVTLQIVSAPAKRDLVFISPWDRTVHVPPWANESNNYVKT